MIEAMLDLQEIALQILQMETIEERRQLYERLRATDTIIDLMDAR